MLRFVTGLTALLVLAAVPAWSDPGKYPEYAKVETSDKIPVQYIRVEELARHILDRKPLILVDVRQPRSYAMQHITGARSIPLGVFYRGGKDLVPKEGLVVLY
jgi:3-mercaptopyruvate sulfurtransferase SseA